MRALGHALAALAALLALPLAVLALAVRPRWWNGLGERLGAWPRQRPGAVWVHASAVGEIRAALGLVDALEAAGHRVVTSTWTLPGRAAMRRWRPKLACHLAPLDHPWCVAAALSRVAPAALVLVETELWPAWIAAAARRGIPVLVVSGRLSDRSLVRYRRLGPLVERSLQRLTWIGARSELDAERFCALGAPAARVRVTGDLKLDVTGETPALAADLVALLGDAPLFVAGSTRPGEEEAVLDAWDTIVKSGATVALAIVPRQPVRGPEVERAAARRGRRVRLRSRAEPGVLGAGDVLVVDTLGELAALYARAEVAFVGGTLVPIGGHNVLEPVLAGRPVLYGPHIQSVRHAVELLDASGAGRCVRDAAELAQGVLDWLADPAAARALGEHGRESLARERGSTGRSAALIESALARPGAP